MTFRSRPLQSRLKKICTRSNDICHLFGKKIHLYKQLGYLFTGNTNSFEQIGYPIRSFSEEELQDCVQGFTVLNISCLHVVSI